MFTPASKLSDGRIISLALIIGDVDTQETALAIFNPETDSWIRLSDLPSN